MKSLIEEKIKIQAMKNNGYITSLDLECLSVSRSTIASLVKKGKYRRVGKGIFILDSHIEDSLYSFSLKYTKMVFARRSALYLNNMTNKQLLVIEGNFPQGYNTGRIKEIKCHHPREPKFSIGVTRIETASGNEVNSYDKERCICDLFFI